MTARDLGRAAAQAMLRTDPLSKESVDLIADKVMDAFAPGYRTEVLAGPALWQNFTVGGEGMWCPLCAEHQVLGEISGTIGDLRAAAVAHLKAAHEVTS